MLLPFPHPPPFASTSLVLYLFKDNTNRNMLRFIKSSCYAIVNSGYEEFLSITKAPQRAMNVVLHCCQMQNPQGGLGVRIKAFQEVKSDEKLYIFIRSHLLSGHRILKFYVSMPMPKDNVLTHC